MSPREDIPFRVERQVPWVFWTAMLGIVCLSLSFILLGFITHRPELPTWTEKSIQIHCKKDGFLEIFRGEKVTVEGRIVEFDVPIREVRCPVQSTTLLWVTEKVFQECHFRYKDVQICLRERRLRLAEEGLLPRKNEAEGEEEAKEGGKKSKTNPWKRKRKLRVSKQKLADSESLPEGFHRVLVHFITPDDIEQVRSMRYSSGNRIKLEGYHVRKNVLKKHPKAGTREYSPGEVMVVEEIAVLEGMEKGDA